VNTITVDPEATASTKTPQLLDILSSAPQEFPVPTSAYRIVVRLGGVSVATTIPKDYPERPPLLVADLGWTREEAANVRAQLSTFAEDWDRPEMDAYDAL
jgi:hypothetical protein